jgi:hypothetical protein
VADTRKRQAAGLTPGKAALIGALAIVLVGVLYWQFSGANSSPNLPAAGEAPHRPVAIAAKQAPATPVTKTGHPESKPFTEVAAVVDPSAWKSPKLTEVMAYDPFAVPSAFPKPQAIDAKSGKGDGLVAAAQADDAKKMAEAVALLEMQLRELEQRGVQVIVRDRNQYAAMIGDRIVHVGDEIDGFTVTVIDPASGVRVERKPAK